MYRCLILDHDDTVAISSATIHYPAYLEVMRQLRPHLQPVSYEGWIIKNLDPGIMGYFQDELGMDDEEMHAEYTIWRSYSSRTDPPFYSGIIDFLSEYRRRGGLICVVSHSEADIITRNYRKASGDKILPDLIFGWESPPERRKPNPWPVDEIRRRFALDASEVLVVDDLKPGVDMARAAGVSVAAAGWAYDIERVREYMVQASDCYFSTVCELRDHIFAQESF